MNDKDRGQLDKLLGNKKEVAVCGDVVEVSEVTMKNFRAFSAACTPFFAEFGEAGRLENRIDAKTGDRIPNDEFALYHVLADHSDAFMAAAVLVTNRPLHFYQQLTPDQFFDVAAAMVEVNGNFFIRSLAPAIIRLAKTIEALGTTGLTVSKP